MEEFVNESIICILIILGKFHKKVQVLLLLFKKILCVSGNYSLIQSTKSYACVIEKWLNCGFYANSRR